MGQRTKKTEERLTEKGLTSSSSKGLGSYRPAIAETKVKRDSKTTQKKKIQTSNRESESEREKARRSLG
jgi:hypothetical protein